jgi:DNA-binding CsgD family transcriptional regulator
LNPRRGLDDRQARLLTETEHEIARLVATGQRNKEVAAALSVAVRTVEWNLSKIYRKLRVRSRTELAAHMARRPE